MLLRVHLLNLKKYLITWLFLCYSSIGSGSVCRHRAWRLKKGARGRSLCPSELTGIACHLSLTSTEWWLVLCALLSPILLRNSWMCCSCPAVERCCVLPELFWASRSFAFYLLTPARTVAGQEMMGANAAARHVLSAQLYVFFQNKECAVARSVALSKLFDRHLFEKERDWYLFHGLFAQIFACVYVVQILTFSK